MRSADAAGRREPGLLPRPIPADEVRFETSFKLYHMGDTGLFGDMRLIGDYYKPDLIMIPIGGHFVMDPVDAAYATREMLKPRSPSRSTTAPSRCYAAPRRSTRPRSARPRPSSSRSARATR